MSRSTFSILPYINRQKVKADGTANIFCRITVDGKSAAISTGISCTPQEWNAKKGEVRNARDNGRLAGFLAEVKDKYNSLLTTNGIITVEMLKAVLKDKDTTGRFLLNFGDTIVEWYRTSKARQTFLHKRTWQKNLRAFVHSLDKDDIAFEDIDENFGGGIQAVPETRPGTYRQLREPLPSLAEHVDVQGSGQEHYPLQSHSQDRV